MTVSFVNAGGAGSTTTNGVSLTLTMPTGLAAGDLLMVFNVAKWNASGYGGDPWTVPSGWSALPPLVVTGTFDPTEKYVQHVFWKVAGSSEPSVTIAQSGAASSPRWRSIVMAWRGVVSPTTITCDQETQYTSTAPTTITPASSTAKAGLLVMFSAQGGVSGATPGYASANSFTVRSPGSYSGSLMRGGVGSRENHGGGAVTWPTFDQTFARDWLFTKIYIPQPSSWVRGRVWGPA
jgi:hypothetical protein